VERFRKTVLDIHDEKLKGTTTITIDWRDPAIAARWANDFVALANDLLRGRAIDESTRNIDYLNKQLEHTTVVEIQHAMYGLVEAQTKSLMLAHGRLEYASRSWIPQSRRRFVSAPAHADGHIRTVHRGCFRIIRRLGA